MLGASFAFSDIEFKRYGGVKLIYARGELTNGSDKQYNTAAFRLNIYDGASIAWTGVLKIRGLRKGQTKPFELPLEGAEAGLEGKISKYEIFFESGY